MNRNLSTTEEGEFFGVKIETQTGAPSSLQNRTRLLHIKDAFLAKDVDAVNMQLAVLLQLHQSGQLLIQYVFSGLLRCPASAHPYFC